MLLQLLTLLYRSTIISGCCGNFCWGRMSTTCSSSSTSTSATAGGYLLLQPQQLVVIEASEFVHSLLTQIKRVA